MIAVSGDSVHTACLLSNRNMKKLLPFLLSLSVITPAFAAFPDTRGHQYEEAINYVQSEGIVSGYLDGSYKPNQHINRAEFTKILFLTYIDEQYRTNSASDRIPDQLARDYNCFPGVHESDWYALHVCQAKWSGIVNGYPDRTFRPANPINVAEAAKIVVNTFGVPIPATVGSTQWYEPYLAALRTKNALPYPEPAPSSLLTRGQMAEIIYRVRNTSGGGERDCVVSGCSGQLCVEEGDPGISTCEWRPEYACYRYARCERQPNGQCGWTMAPSWRACLDDPIEEESGQDLPYAEGIIGNGRQSVLFFWASWCPYCKTNDERLKKWEDDGLLDFNAYKVNYDTESDLKNRYGVVNQDTHILIDGDGDEIRRVTFPSEEALRDLVQ